MNYRELLRLCALKDISCRMSEDDVRALRQLAEKQDVMDSLHRQEAVLNDLSKRVGSHPFASDLVANVAGNAVTEGIVWLARILFKR